MKRITAGACSILAIAALAGCGQDVTTVEVDPPQISFKKTTQSETIEAKALDIRDAPVEGVAFTFESEDSSVATVDSGGVVKPAGNGSTAVIAKTKEGVQGETFVKVCLPDELECDPADKLELKVGLAAPIKCRVLDCEGEKMPTRIEMTPAESEEKMLLKEGENVFIGLAVGDTEVEVEGLGLEKTVAVHIDEQDFAPGMGPGSGGGGRGGGGGGGKKDDKPYGKTSYDHILKNMKFGGD
jgi:hypothetical protein